MTRVGTFNEVRRLWNDRRVLGSLMMTMTMTMNKLVLYTHSSERVCGRIVVCQWNIEFELDET